MDSPSVVASYAGTPAVQPIPKNIVESGKMSITSSAPECFVNQRFSLKLQTFLISYVIMVSSQHAVHAV